MIDRFDRKTVLALVTTCVDARMRGAFMRLSSAAQNLAAGVASLLAGAMIGHAADASLTGFGALGFCAAGLTLACVVIARKLRPVADGDAAAPLVAATRG